MTLISITDKKVIIVGHSNYAPIGNDIVCASISTATIFLQRLMKTDYLQEYGYLKINCIDGNKYIIDTFCDLMKDLMFEYPDYVEVFDSRK